MNYKYLSIEFDWYNNTKELVIQLDIIYVI